MWSLSFVAVSIDKIWTVHSSSLQHNGFVDLLQFFFVWIIENAHGTREKWAPFHQHTIAAGKSCNANLIVQFGLTFDSVFTKYVHKHNQTHTNTRTQCLRESLFIKLPMCNCVIDNNPGHKYCHIQAVAHIHDCHEPPYHIKYANKPKCKVCLL